MLDRCTRIWCVRPVPMRTSRNVKPAKRRRTRYSVQAARPRPKRAVMRVRWRGSRAMGFSMRPRSGLHVAMHQGEVGLLHLAAGEQRGQRAMRGVVLGDQDHAAGEAVQAMHDAGPQIAAQRGKRSGSGRAGRSPACRYARPRRRAPPCRRVCRWPRGPGLRRARGAGWLRARRVTAAVRRAPRRSGRPRAERARSARRCAVDEHASALDPVLQAGAADIRETARVARGRGAGRCDSRGASWRPRDCSALWAAGKNLCTTGSRQ